MRENQPPEHSSRLGRRSGRARTPARRSRRPAISLRYSARSRASIIHQRTMHGGLPKDSAEIYRSLAGTSLRVRRLNEARSSWPRGRVPVLFKISISHSIRLPVVPV
ncbi:hypothetical protein EVAR_61778_1 [Eumeta japonica]|uniref:Uncharacterized protein n=1 Tax=Eumeta variegata TaxID=151549 RepID=A0A4C1Z1H4_EUMVA|nr:hypothetical protein EVAR_61778_1 [Eumeta japonica]